MHGIRRVAPGEILRFDANGLVETRSSNIIEFAERRRDAPPPLDIDAALKQACRLHMRSDVPVGVFISSGVDSVSVSTCLKDLGLPALFHYSARVNCAGSVDETIAAEEITAANGGRFVRVDVDPDETFELLPAIVGQMDDLNFDFSMIPNYFLARRAAQDVKVVLAGNGGDEAFGGYVRYQRHNMPFHELGAYRGKRRFPRDMLIDPGPDPVNAQLLSLLAPFASAPLDSLQKFQTLDLLGYMPAFHLTTLDRMLMAFSVEGRTPLLHEPMVAAAYLAPADCKVHWLKTKYALRRWLDRHGKVYRAFAPKRGFSVPVESLARLREDRLRAYVLENEGVAKLIAPAALAAFAPGQPNYSIGRLVTLLFFALWYDVHVLRNDAGYRRIALTA
jgi:asparagine synthase (glutamine-hydrolysing)